MASVDTDRCHIPEEKNREKSMKNLNYRKKLQICKAYMINAMEDFLSSIVKTNFADSMSAEFVVRLAPFELSQHGISQSTTNHSLFMYPLNPEKYNIPNKFTGFDGAVSMEMITRHVLGNLNTRKKRSDELTLVGFDLKTTVYVFEVLRKDGIEVLREKISTIQNSLGFHNIAEHGSEYAGTSFDSDNQLIQCMLNIIEEIDPKTFFSQEFQKIKSLIVSKE